MRLWIAQGFGIGRIPFAPGTFGSVLGLGWFALLLASGRVWVLATGTVVGLALSVWLCGVAERALGQTDPGSVVLDEIAAMPVCFFAWLGILYCRSGALPGLEAFFLSRQRWLTIGCLRHFAFSTSRSRGPFGRASLGLGDGELPWMICWRRSM